MTSNAALRSIRESIELAVAASEVAGSEAVREQIDAAVEFYALNYSRFMPALLFDEVRRARAVVARLLTIRRGDHVAHDLQRSAGWLSALLGNLAFHLDDHAGARTHLAAAVELGRDAGDAHLTAWTCGAQSMVARYDGRHADALERAQQGLAHAHTPLLRAQLLSWAQLPALAGLGRAPEAEQTVEMAVRELESAPNWSTPGRFGFDPAELELHAAESHLVLDRPGVALRHAVASAEHCRSGTPGWAAASLTIALAESRGRQHDRAAAHALMVLERIPPESLRSTSRRRLATLDRSLPQIEMSEVRLLRAQLAVLPPLTEPRETGADTSPSTDGDVSSA
jgi:hypothetical protein